MKFRNFWALVTFIAYAGAVIASTIAASKTSEQSTFVIAFCFAILYAVPWIVLNMDFIDKVLDRLVDWELNVEARWDEWAAARLDARKPQ